MTDVIMNGCNGHMGRTITSIVENTDDVRIVAGIDKFSGIPNSYPVFEDISRCDVKADVIIDFSSPSCCVELLDYAVRTGTPVVFCTTGISAEQAEYIKKASEKVAVLRSANMSIGINIMAKLIKEAAKQLAPAGFDIEIVEKHHSLKKDAPSGTAILLADSVNDALDNKYAYVYDRSERSEKRPQYEIGISSVRAGNIPGDHDVIFAGEDEVITFSHRAYSKAVFGRGAVQAAVFLKGKGPGMYDMSMAVGGN